MPPTTNAAKTTTAATAAAANSQPAAPVVVAGDGDETHFSSQPLWLSTMFKKYLGGVAPVFILQGNTHDYYQYVGEKLRWCIVSNLLDMQRQDKARVFGVVVTFSRYARFAFPDNEMRDKFLEIANKSQTIYKLPAPLTAENYNALISQYGMGYVTGLLSNVLAYKGKDGVSVGVVIEYADTLIPETLQLGENERTVYTAVADWAKDQIVGAAGNLGRMHHLVVLISEEPNGLYAPLRRIVREIVTVPMPDTATRETFIGALLKVHKRVKLSDNLTGRVLANLTAGLTLRQIEDIFLLAAAERTPVTLELARRRKDELIKNEYGDVLTITDPRLTFAGLGGMTTIKPYLLAKVVKPMLAGKTKRVPQGLLFSGPAGTGKTVLAEALAGEMGTSFIKFNIAKIKDKFVGQSERNMQRALDMLEIISPAVLFIDELDQTVSQNREAGGDSGVSNNLLGQLLAWAADTSRRGKVLLVGATNRPDLLDAALKREGRFDLKVPVLAPEADERPHILAVQLGRYFPAEVALPTPQELAPLTAHMRGYTGAILEAIASIAYGEWDDSEGELSVLEAVAEATRSFQPTTAELQAMTDLALQTCSDLRVLPLRYQEELEQKRRQYQEALEPPTERFTRRAHHEGETEGEGGF